MSTIAFRDRIFAKALFWSEKFFKIVYLSNNYSNIKQQIGDELKAEGLRAGFIATFSTEIDRFVIDAL